MLLLNLLVSSGGHYSTNLLTLDGGGDCSSGLKARGGDRAIVTWTSAEPGSDQRIEEVTASYLAMSLGSATLSGYLEPGDTATIHLRSHGGALLATGMRTQTPGPVPFVTTLRNGAAQSMWRSGRVTASTATGPATWRSSCRP